MDQAKENAYTKEVSCKMKYVYKNVHHFNHSLENSKVYPANKIVLTCNMKI